jgi:hypothetical protein
MRGSTARSRRGPSSLPVRHGVMLEPIPANFPSAHFALISLPCDECPLNEMPQQVRACLQARALTLMLEGLELCARFHADWFPVWWEMKGFLGIGSAVALGAAGLAEPLFLC